MNIKSKKPFCNISNEPYLNNITTSVNVSIPQRVILNIQKDSYTHIIPADTRLPKQIYPANKYELSNELLLFA